MQRPEGERLAAIEQHLVDIDDDLKGQAAAARGDHHRLRSVEEAVNRLLEAQKVADRAVETRQRRIEVRVQLLAAVIALVGIVEPFLYAFIHK